MQALPYNQECRQGEHGSDDTWGRKVSGADKLKRSVPFHLYDPAL